MNEDCDEGHECAGTGTERKCVDINECTDERFANDTLAFCGENSYCYNFHGTFYCYCNEGYGLWEADVGCRDINECTWSSWNWNVG